MNFKIETERKRRVGRSKIRHMDAIKSWTRYSKQKRLQVDT